MCPFPGLERWKWYHRPIYRVNKIGATEEVPGNFRKVHGR